MSLSRRRSRLLLPLLLLAGAVSASGRPLAGTPPAGARAADPAPPERSFYDPQGRVVVTPLPVEARFLNPWTPELEEGFRERASHVLRFFADRVAPAGTAGDGEKDSYPAAMLQFLVGNRSAALRTLQAEDVQKEDHAHTAGIDLYWAPTLQAQVRKYFFFGEYLDPAYRQRLREAARLWTEHDPLRRSHPVYGEGKPGRGAGPDVTGSWVDLRETDSLRAMRDTSIYLLAEESGNESTRSRYRDQLARYVTQLYHVGMSEWDSDRFHGQTLAPYHNLYDFAKDPHVKALARAALDWLYTAAALKYYRGGFTGPNCRDSGGGNVVFGADVSHPLHLYFGDSPAPDPRPDREDVYRITSAYRPPQAVVALARKQFARPVEVWAAKPPSLVWKPDEEAAPRYWETQYYGHSYQMGSVVSAEPDAEWSVSPFKLIAFNSLRGADYFVATTGPRGLEEQGDQIGQFRNLLLWLRPAADPDAAEETRFYFQVPKSAVPEVEDGVWFFRYERTWLALRPISLAPYELAPRGDPLAGPRARDPRYRDERFLRAAAIPGARAGLALEAGEPETHGDYAEFKKSVLSRGSLDLSRLAEGTARLTGMDGAVLEVTHNPENDLPRVVRNGVSRAWEKERDLYRAPGGRGPVALGWREGALRVEAGGRVFESRVSLAGEATSREEPAAGSE